MQTFELENIMTDSAAEVLETMFFTSLADDPEPQTASDLWLSSRLSFCGNSSGNFGVRVPLDTARKLAANFLGLEEETILNSQIGEVVCELSNMLCGSVLSKLEKDAHMKLTQPELDAEGDAGKEPREEAHTASRALESEYGPLSVWLEWEPA